MAAAEAGRYAAKLPVVIMVQRFECGRQENIA